MRYLGVAESAAKASRSPERAPGAAATTSQSIFAFRLRLHRERKRLSLDDVSRVMRVVPGRLDALERGDLAGWPHGVYARAWVRAYATVVGLDPTDTVDEFCRLFPHGDRRARETMRELAAIVALPCGYRDEHREVDRRRGMQHTDRATVPSWRTLILRAADALWSIRAGRDRGIASRTVSARRASAIP
ncbi:MAG: helix-turn-helix domain-containing protein [Acidobacteria bacterium]|nr:helix-turn-helix domain-containing protein [Acidobacteriota bacterium]